MDSTRCTISPRNPCNRRDRVKQYYEYETKVNTNGLRYPVKVRDVKRFEDNNPELAINVLTVDDAGVIYPLRATKKRGTTIWMLLLTEGEKTHYVLVSDMSRLLSRQISKNHKHRHFCLNCLYSTYIQRVMDAHAETCWELNPTVRVKFPSSAMTSLKARNGD